MKLNCLITESDATHRAALEQHIAMIPDLHIAGRCINSIDTFLFLQVHDIDLLFIDIQMPELGGPDLIQCLKKAPLVIFTTSSSNADGALDAFEMDAVDYLLKPFSFERFLKAIDKVYARIRAERNQRPLPHANDCMTIPYIFIKSDDGLSRIDYNDLLYVEGLENYVKLVCESKMITSLNTMKSIESMLPSGNFLRIHRSFIVNMNKVENIRDGCFHIGNKEIVLGRSYRKLVQSILHQKYAIRIT
jgi:DNA-binding LytR/AlgR family response regulator